MIDVIIIYDFEDGYARIKFYVNRKTCVVNNDELQLHPDVSQEICGIPVLIPILTSDQLPPCSSLTSNSIVVDLEKVYDIDDVVDYVKYCIEETIRFLKTLKEHNVNHL